jgi:hypothetical protein
MSICLYLIIQFYLIKEKNYFEITRPNKKKHKKAPDNSTKKKIKDVKSI